MVAIGNRQPLNLGKSATGIELGAGRSPFCALNSLYGQARNQGVSRLSMADNRTSTLAPVVNRAQFFGDYLLLLDYLGYRTVNPLYFSSLGSLHYLPDNTHTLHPSLSKPRGYPLALPRTNGATIDLRPTIDHALDPRGNPLARSPLKILRRSPSRRSRNAPLATFTGGVPKISPRFDSKRTLAHPVDMGSSAPAL